MRSLYWYNFWKKGFQAVGVVLKIICKLINVFIYGIGCDYTYKGIPLPDEVLRSTLVALEHFTVRSSDVLIATYPKSGTHWVCKIMDQLYQHNELPGNSQSERSPKCVAQRDCKLTNQAGSDDLVEYLELANSKEEHLSTLDKKQGQRLFRSHLPLQCLPADFRNGKGKIIYVYRNPKDVCVSLYHFISDYGYVFGWKYLLRSFLAGNVPYGSWYSHIHGFWNKRDEATILFVSYESLHKQFAVEIARIAKFLGFQVDAHLVNDIRDACCFETMSKESNNLLASKASALFTRRVALFRRGTIGDWKNILTPEQNRLFDNHHAEAWSIADLSLEFS